MAATIKYRQDLPPPGGYEKINYQRVPPKSFFKGKTMFLGYLAMTAGACYIYKLTLREVQRKNLEHLSCNMAIWPLLMAERDREYLKQLRRNRDYEKELMKDVEGWEVGTWYGEPIYKTKDEDFLVPPLIGDYYVHATEKSFRDRVYLTLFL